MKNAYQQTWRVHHVLFEEDARFEELMRLLTRHERTADEIAYVLAEPSTRAYHPLEDVAAQAAVFAKRAPRMRAAGIRFGINVWPSFGTGESYNTLADAPENPFDRMVGADGTVDANLACPTSPEFLAYIREKYTIMAKAGPEFIWVDDDCRFTDLNGVPFPCFCPRCVQGFENGRFASREELVTALNRPENKALRHSWSSYGGDRLAAFCAEVRKAVDAVDPSIDTPFMTVGPTHTTFSGDFIPKCMNALRARRGRPGHGFYWDACPDDMLGKCMEAGRQVMLYPEQVQEIVYEEESCPTAYGEKAFRTRRNEITLALAIGCNGVAFNHMPVLTKRPEQLLAREVDELADCRPRWERFVQFADGLPLTGLWPAFSWYMTADRPLEGDSWFTAESSRDYRIEKPEAMGRIGLPLTPSPEHADITLLAGKTLRAFSDEELTKIFSGNVIMDIFALQELEKLGLGHLAGVRSGKPHPATFETLTNHPLNAGFAGDSHSGIFQAAYDLLPEESAQQLAYIQDPYGNRHGCCLTLFENALGGKVAVSGYDCWRFIGDPHKVWQFGAIARWMGVSLTLRWPNPMQVSRLQPFVRADEKRAAVLLVNASLDASYPTELLLRTAASRAVLLADDGTETALPCAREGDCLRIAVGSIAPWDTLTVLAE